MFTESDVARLWSKINVKGPDDCWNWTAKANIAGYGSLTMWVDGRWRGFRAHRATLMLATGLFPPSEVNALHSCDNPACCNPAHLRWGSPKDNAQDAWDRGRASPPPKFYGTEHYMRRNPHMIRKGEQIGTSILTEAEVRAIYKLHMKRLNASRISEQTGHSVAVIADICSGKSWKHLHGTKGAPTLAELKTGGVRRNKLTDEDKVQILKCVASGMTNREVAAKFNISTAPVSYLRARGRTW